MKKLTSIILAALFMAGLASCSFLPDSPIGGEPSYTPADDTADLGDDGQSFGESLDEGGAYEGYFEEETDLSDLTVTCVSGTQGAYSVSGATLTFSALSADSVYSISGKLSGNIIIDAGDDFKLDLELTGFSMVCGDTNPITVLSGDEVSITAKSGTENFIYDTREAVDSTDESLRAAAVYSYVDLEICGKGALTVISENNKGIHTKDDLQIKNLTLTVSCTDNALKGNDSVTLESGTTTLIATAGDCIKTENTDISSKGNQRGTVTVSGGNHTLYAACDGIDAAYDVIVEGDTVLNIYTDKYSNYSSEVTAVSEDVYYIRFTSDAYSYSVRYYNSDSDFCWVNAESHSTVSGGRSNYYYYSFPKMSEYSKMQFYIYSSDMEQGQDGEYLAASELMTPSGSYDTFALSARGNSLSYSWTNYTTRGSEGGFGGGRGPGGMGGFGGMGEGNTDKGEYSTKGIKAGNAVTVYSGTVNIKSYDDAIHANADSTLENGDSPTGNVTVKGGVISLYSNDDGLHADGTLEISGGTVSVAHSYEGAEGNAVIISGGNLSVISSDDGINSTATSGQGVTLSGGTVYIHAGGDGIDANSRTSYQGIVFEGSRVVVISTSGGNSAIDTEQGYTYTGGSVLALMPRGGMSSEATHCKNFSSVGTSSSVSLGSSHIAVKVGGATAVTAKAEGLSSALAIYLGDTDASFSATSAETETAEWN